MRIKSDFVTNSSSSSFLVAWPKKIETMQDVLQFIPQQEKASVVYHDALEQVPVHLSEGNFDYDFEPATKKITEDFANFFKDGYTGTVNCYDLADQIRRRVIKELFPSKRDFTGKDWDKIDDETKSRFVDQYGKTQEELQHERAVDLAKTFIESAKGKWIYKFHYGDEDGNFYSELEHGGTFDGLVSIQVSHH